LGQAKNDWQIIRKVFSYSKKLLFITNFFRNNKIVFNSKNVYQFKNYAGLQHYAISNLNNLAFQFLKKITGFHLKNFKFKKAQKKIFKSQIRFWLNDFYIDGKDINSKYSSTMIQCSKLSRLNNTNFKY
jgi:aldehyde:ferredoxin oxidoreductase